MGFLKSLGKPLQIAGKMGKTLANPLNLSKKDALGGMGALGIGALALGGGGEAMPFLAPLLGGAMSAYGADQATKKQIAWERERATHAHQWEVQDLINAGLNPILSAGGNGAVTGGISAPVPDFSAIANSGAEVARIKNENKLAKSTIEHNDSQVKLNKANTELTELQKGATTQNTLHTAEMVRRAKAEADLAEAQRDAQLPLLRSEKYYNETEQAQTMNNLEKGGGTMKNLAYYLINNIIDGGTNTAKNANEIKRKINQKVNEVLNEINKRQTKNKKGGGGR